MFTPEFREPYPPEGWPLGKMGYFHKLSFKMQYFIFLKYTLKWPKKCIKKYMFIISETTYYRYDHKAKNIMKEVYKPE